MPNGYSDEELAEVCDACEQPRSAHYPHDWRCPKQDPTFFTPRDKRTKALLTLKRLMEDPDDFTRHGTLAFRHALRIINEALVEEDELKKLRAEVKKLEAAYSDLNGRFEHYRSCTERGVKP